MRRRALLLALPALPALAAAAAPAARREHAITVAAMAFGPAPADLRAGDVVVWINTDVVRHTATARDGSFDVELPPKGRARATIGNAGVHAYFCRYHPAMTGRLTVRG